MAETQPSKEVRPSDETLKHLKKCEPAMARMEPALMLEQNLRIWRVFRPHDIHCYEGLPCTQEYCVPGLPVLPGRLHSRLQGGPHRSDQTHRERRSR